MTGFGKGVLLATASFATGVALLMANDAEAADGADLLDRAVEECGPDTPHVEINDAGWLVVDHIGEAETHGATLDQLACVVWVLNPPSDITARMDSTTPDDGVQVGRWDGLTAQWTYHPNTGLDVIITH